MFAGPNEFETQELHGTIPEDRYMTLRRVEEEVRRVAGELGYQGDPLATRLPCVGTIRQEEAVLGICLALPSDVRLAANSMAKRMVRAIVLTQVIYSEKPSEESSGKEPSQESSPLSLSVKSL